MTKQEFFKKIKSIKLELEEQYELKKQLEEKKNFTSEEYFSIKSRISFLKRKKEKLKNIFNSSKPESFKSNVKFYPKDSSKKQNPKKQYKNFYIEEKQRRKNENEKFI